MSSFAEMRWIQISRELAKFSALFKSCIPNNWLPMLRSGGYSPGPTPRSPQANYSENNKPSYRKSNCKKSETRLFKTGSCPTVCNSPYFCYNFMAATSGLSVGMNSWIFVNILLALSVWGFKGMKRHSVS